jgi:hypothetical protein
MQGNFEGYVIRRGKMEKKNFEQYGDLEWLETADYYAGAWSVVEGTAKADDGECYTVVISMDKTDMRYTIT